MRLDEPELCRIGEYRKRADVTLRARLLFARPATAAGDSRPKFCDRGGKTNKISVVAHGPNGFQNTVSRIAGRDSYTLRSPVENPGRNELGRRAPDESARR